MTAAQQQVFNMLVQSAGESRSHLREGAWTSLGVLLLLGIIVLTAVAIWILHGGLTRNSHFASLSDRQALEKWLRDP